MGFSGQLLALSLREPMLRVWEDGVGVGKSGQVAYGRAQATILSAVGTYFRQSRQMGHSGGFQSLAQYCLRAATAPEEIALACKTKHITSAHEKEKIKSVSKAVENHV